MKTIYKICIMSFSVLILGSLLLGACAYKNGEQEKMISSAIGYYEFEKIIFYKNNETKEVSDTKELMGLSTANWVAFIISSREIVSFSTIIDIEDKRIEYSINNDCLVLKESMRAFGMGFDFNSVVFNDDLITITNIKGETERDVVIYKKKFDILENIPLGHYRFENLIIKDANANIVFQTQDIMTTEQINQFSISTDIRFEFDSIEMQLYTASNNKLLNKYFYRINEDKILFFKQ